MNGGLLLLVRRGWWGKVRFLGRKARTVKGALSVGAGALFLGGMVAVQLWGAALSRRQGEVPSPEAVLTYLPAALVLLALMGALGGRALYFTRPEVDFLFPAPVSRRELLMYGLLARLDLQVLSGLWTALFVTSFASHWATAALAMVLAFVFVYTTAQAVGLAAAAAEPWLPRNARRLAVLILAAGALAVVASAVAAAPPGATLDDRVRLVALHPVVQAASVVTRPFAELFVARTIGGALLWLGVCLAVIGAEVGLMLAFDVAYTERSLAVSRRIHERLRRMQSGGGALVGTAPTLRRVRLPSLRFLGAAEPLARRQLLELARNPRVLLPPVLIGAIWLTAILVGSRDDESRLTTAITAVIVGIVFPILFTAHVGYDFRRDLDRMPLLKSLPLKPMTVAVGQVFTVALVFAGVQLLMAGAVAALTGAIPGSWLLGMVLAVPPFSWAAITVDNALFLFMPYRVSTGGEPNMQFVGKTMLAMFLKLVVLGVVTVVALAAAWGVYALTGAAVVPAALAGAAAMAALCVPLTWVVAEAFTAFDVSRDVPAES